MKIVEAVRERERERERESNNLRECKTHVNFNENIIDTCRGVHCTSVFYGNDPIDVGAILIACSTEECPNNKTKNYAEIELTCVGAAFGSPLFEGKDLKNKKNRAMPMKNGRPKGVPTKNENNKFNNTISNEQCSPLQNAGITLIALIITIILLLILAGVTIHFTLGENGILRNAEIAVNKYEKSQAREKLQTALAYAQMQKNINKDYNSGEFLEKLLAKEGISLVGNTASVDGYTFLIDREKLIIVEEIEEEPTKVQIAKVVTSYLGKKEDGKYYVKANVTIKSEEEIERITLEDGRNIEITPSGNTATKELELEIGRKYKVITITKGGVTNTNTLIEEKEEKVSNVNELVELRNNVNKGLTYEGKIITQTQDIDLSSVCGEGNGSWEPIGYVDENRYIFNGTYNGNGNIITNLYIDTTEDKTIGLFGFLGYGGTVKNVILYGKIKQRNGNRAAGGIVGRNEGTIDNCINNASVENNKMTVGGIAGNNLNTVKNCINNGKIMGCNCGTGGIVGSGGDYITTSSTNTQEAIIENCKNSSMASVEGIFDVGGICGISHINKIDNCINEGNVTASSSIVGGIVGESKIDVNNCKNNGTVTSNGNPDDPENTQGTGGIAGRTTANIRCSSNEGTIKSKGFYVGGILGKGGENTLIGQCYNKGSVEAEQNAVGGIVGCSAKGIWNCYNYLDGEKKIKANYNAGGIMGNAGNIPTDIINCYSIGENIIGESNAAILGSWWIDGVNISNCYYLDTSTLNGTGNNYSGKLKENNIYKKSIGDFTLSVDNSNSVAYKLYNGGAGGGVGAWSQQNGINQDFPYLVNCK